MKIGDVTGMVKFSVGINNPVCAKLLAGAGLLPSDSKLSGVIRSRNLIKVDSAPHDDPSRINYQYFKQDNYDEWTDKIADLVSDDRSFEFLFANAVRDYLGLDEADYFHYIVSFRVKKRDIRYEPVVEFSVIFNDKEIAVDESLGYPFTDGYAE